MLNKKIFFSAIRWGFSAVFLQLLVLIWASSCGVNEKVKRSTSSKHKVKSIITFYKDEWGDAKMDGKLIGTAFFDETGKLKSITPSYKHLTSSVVGEYGFSRDSYPILKQKNVAWIIDAYNYEIDPFLFLNPSLMINELRKKPFKIEWFNDEGIIKFSSSKERSFNNKYLTGSSYKPISVYYFDRFEKPIAFEYILDRSDPKLYSKRGKDFIYDEEDRLIEIKSYFSNDTIRKFYTKS